MMWPDALKTAVSCLLLAGILWIASRFERELEGDE